MCCSFLEVHLNTVRDLLATDMPGKTLQVHANHDASASSLAGVTIAKASSAQEVEGLFAMGLQRRASSHPSLDTLIFRMVIEPLDGTSTKKWWGKLNLVSLPGSQRCHPMTEVQRKEAIDVNMTLTTLAAVLHDASRDIKSSRKARESKLTMLLLEALTGTSCNTLIANISPSETDVDETISTLRLVGSCCHL